MESSKLYLQLYSLRHETASDAEGTLRRVRSLGFDGVELAGDYGWSAEKWRALLDETGLTAIATHAGLESLEDPSASARMTFCKTLGIKYIVIPSLSKEFQTPKGYGEAAKRLSALGRKWKDEGFLVGYHNHAFEFDKLENGECGMDILLAESDPEYVHFEFDAFWLEHGGQNAVEFVRKHANRVFLIHAKDLRKRDMQDVAVGQGDVDFQSLIPLCTANDWPVVLECESPNAIELVRQGAAFLRPLLG